MSRDCILVLLALTTACGTESGPASDAAVEGDAPMSGKICDPCKLPWACNDTAHWTAASIVQCPSPGCPAQCTRGAWCVYGDVQSCGVDETCDVMTPRDAGSPCVAVDAGASD